MPVSRWGTVKDGAVGGMGRALGRFFPTRLPASSPSSILILKPCCLGDVLMATPVVAALRRAFPQARLDFAVGPWSAPALAGNSHLDGLVDCGPVGSGRRYPLRQYLALAARLRRGGYDWCFVLDRSPLIGLLPWLAGIPHRIGLDSAGRGFAHTVRVPVREGRHEVETYLDVLRAVGLLVQDLRLGFHPSVADRQRAEELLPPLAGRRLLALHPGGGINPGMTLATKRWPLDRVAALAERAAKDDLLPVLVGAPYDVPAAEGVQALANCPVLNLAGRTSLGELGAVLEHCAVFVGNDTGAMHLAVAVGTPAVALFGPSDPRVYGPYGLGEAVSAGLACSPCFRAGRAPHCPRARCMDAISVDTVWGAVLRQMARVGAAGRA